MTCRGRLLQEEREEKALRKAEMEATKATNLLEHEAEIAARPPRAWFLTPRQQADIAKATKPVAGEAKGNTAAPDAAAASKAAKRAKDERNAETKGPSPTLSLLVTCLPASTDARHVLLPRFGQNWMPPLIGGQDERLSTLHAIQLSPGCSSTGSAGRKHGA